MIYKPCPDCGGDAWDNHASCDCKKKKPARCNASAPRENPYQHHIAKIAKNQARINRANCQNAWREHDYA